MTAEGGGRRAEGGVFGHGAEEGEAGARLPGHQVARPVSCFIKKKGEY